MKFFTAALSLVLFALLQLSLVSAIVLPPSGVAAAAAVAREPSSDSLARHSGGLFDRLLSFSPSHSGAAERHPELAPSWDAEVNLDEELNKDMGRRMSTDRGSERRRGGSSSRRPRRMMRSHP